MQTRTVALPGPGPAVRLAVAEAGRGGRPIFLLHGFTGAKEDFTDWLDPLAELGWHAVAPDLRGHGESDKPGDESAYSFEIFAADLVGLMEVMELAPAVALGHSMGGMVLQTAVLSAPESFEALVLMDTSHRPLKGFEPQVRELVLQIVRSGGIEAIMAAQAALPSEGAPLGTPAHERLLASRPGYAAFGDRKMRASSPAMYAAMLTTITDTEAGLDRLPELASVEVPTLVMVGDQDRPFLKPSQRMADAIPGAELAVLAGGGHSPQFEAPEQWWRALSGFLGRI